jgi:hypothetical protein
LWLLTLPSSKVTTVTTSYPRCLCQSNYILGWMYLSISSISINMNNIFKQLRTLLFVIKYDNNIIFCGIGCDYWRSKLFCNNDRYQYVSLVLYLWK